VATGPLLARFYGDPWVARVAVDISATILLTSFLVQHLALLKRAMRFSSLSINDILARAVSVTVLILLGWAALGFWAVVAGASHGGSAFLSKKTQGALNPTSDNTDKNGPRIKLATPFPP